MATGRRGWVVALALAASLLAAGAAAQAGQKPEIVRHDAQYLNLAVYVHLQWQSPNPVTVIRAFIGSEAQEIRVDEYDNRRNRDGYWGEKTIHVKVESAGVQGSDSISIPYVIQIEDDLRQTSERATGKAKVVSAPRTKESDETWGRRHLEGPAPPVASQPVEGVVGQVIDAMTKYGDSTFIQEIQVHLLGTGQVSFTIVVKSPGSLKSIHLEIYDQNNAVVQNTVLSNMDKNGRGTTQAFKLNPGSYRAMARVTNSNEEPIAQKNVDFVVGSE